jgi:ABC-2 type transport system ATP-binding protein
VGRAIEVTGLRKSFGEVTALAGVDMAVEAGEVHGLLGPNGAGKSTLLRILFGLVGADEGQSWIFGRQHAVDGSVSTLAGVAGFVDRPHFYPYLTARRTLELLARADGLPEAPIDEVLAFSGLADAASRKVSGWSTGMLQRLGLAAALLRQPRLLILDEPTEGLDPSGSREVIDLLRLVASDGVTVLLSSHDMLEVDSVCDSATVINKGEVAMSGPLSLLRSAAPPGRLRMTTSDDGAALALAGRFSLKAERHALGGLALEAGPAELHDLVCEMGRRDVSVTRLEQEVPPLTALFYDLTEEQEDQRVGAGAR